MKAVSVAVTMSCVMSLCGQHGAAAAAGQPCAPVAHSRLEALLPVLPKFVRQQPRGETDPAEAVSRTTVDYDGGVPRISIELMDSCGNPDMLAQLREFLSQGAPATAGTVMRSLAIHGFPAFEEWTQESGHGEVHVLVGDRFMVKVTGDVVPSLVMVEDAAKAIPLPRLATLR